MAQSDVLKPYVPTTYPQPFDDAVDPVSEQKWHTKEHDKLKASIALLVQVVKQLEARIVLLGG